MSWQAVFSDIDGTLLNSQHRISARTAAAIRRIIRLGIPFIPVSARPPLAITPFTRQLQSDAPFVCYSGALILDARLETLYSVGIEAQEHARLAPMLAELHQQSRATGDALSINHYAGLHWYSDDPDNPWARQEAAITGLQSARTPDDPGTVHKILLMGQASLIQQAQTSLKAAFPTLSIHRSKDEYLEIMHRQATKSRAIAFLAQNMGLDARRVIAFGDNFNDLDMLEYAGLSVAMGNAPAEIKAVATQVTASNNDDGIAQVLDALFPGGQ